MQSHAFNIMVCIYILLLWWLDFTLGLDEALASREDKKPRANRLSPPIGVWIHLKEKKQQQDNLFKTQSKYMTKSNIYTCVFYSFYIFALTTNMSF